MNRSVELLIPARDMHTGMEAINYGADALYIGAPQFGARQAAGNSLQDLEELVRYAHLYGSKVYVTVNTLLYDEELNMAQRLICQLYEMGIDALIVQDLGIVKLDIPPIRLHASTQCHNNSLERIQFLQKIGMKRAVLAREMDVDFIRYIHEHCDMELEAFVHGSLCVCYSGQCYMSRLMTGRSGNRGECAQVCRTPFDLVDSRGKTLLRDKYLLSLRDMNRSRYVSEMIEAGVVSLKVEGRLKDEQYVKNITAYYRQLLDDLIEKDGTLQRAGSGRTKFYFQPDPMRSFNRGFTSYFIEGKREKMASFDTPKAKGKLIGRLVQDKSGSLIYDGPEPIANGDGLCFVNERGELEGFFVNRVEGRQLMPHKSIALSHRVELYRNVDKQFEKLLSGKGAERKIKVEVSMEERDAGFALSMRDEDGCEAVAFLDTEKVVANNPEAVVRQWRTALSKLGGTVFEMDGFSMQSAPYFLPASALNRLRSEVVERLIEVRMTHFQPEMARLEYRPSPMMESADYKCNITNVLHREVYEDFGAKEVTDGLDKTANFKGREIMVCKYCLRFELGICSKERRGREVHFPLYLKNNGYRFRLEFDCHLCRMKIIYD